MRRESLATIRLSTQSVRIMLKALDEEGLDAQAVLRSAGISTAAARDPQGNLSGEEELRVQMAFVDATRGIPGVWLRTGLRYRLMSYGPLGIAILSAHNVGDGLRVVLAFQDLHYSLLRYSLVEQDGEVLALAADDSHAPAELKEFCLERSLGSVHRVLSDMLQAPPRLARIESKLDRPAGWLDCETLLGSRVVFNSPQSRWIFEKGAGLDPLPMASPLVEETYQSMCARLVEEASVTDDVVGRLFGLLVRAVRDFPNADEAAAALAVSTRTLHRRLDQQHLSFGMVLDQVREQRARLMLEQSNLPVERIAEMLGFAEMSGFSRAFKRWTGVSPRHYRQGAVCTAK